MTIPAPNLDDRRFEELLQELQLLIPKYTPELAIGRSDWTDWNDSDPGTTLLQLWAHLAETVIYRLNQVPDRAYIKFLDLVGLPLRPARPAVADVTFLAKPGFEPGPSGSGIVVPKRTQLSAQPAEGGDPLIFETIDPVDLIRSELASVQVLDRGAFVDVSEQNGTDAPPFRPLGWVPEPGNALYLGFEPADPPIDSPFPKTMRLRFFPPPAAIGEAGCVTAGIVPPSPVELEWQYRRDADPMSWRPLAIYEDTTAALSTGGYMVVEGPKAIEPVAPVGRVEEPRLWLRCRIVSGVFPSGGPEVDLVAPNTVPAENLATVRDELLGESEGHPDQTFVLRRSPMQPGSVELDVGEPDGDAVERWDRKDDLLGSGPGDRHYIVDGVGGTILFGDGRRGRIPSAGAPIIVRSYRHGASDAGNVGPELIATVMTNVAGVQGVVNHRPATGGASAQTVDELRTAAPARLRSLDRAVTAQDYRALALEVGTVARATALPSTHPDHRNVKVPGSVTVVVVPDSDVDAPAPSAELLAEVCRHLDQRRTIATELHVVGPRYRRIKVIAQVEAEAKASFETVKLAAAGAINAAIDPLGRPAPALPGQSGDTQSATDNGYAKAGGEAPAGRDFGRDFAPSSLFSVLLDIEGVAAAPFLSIELDGSPHEGPVVLDEDQLLFGGDDHEISVVPRAERTTRSIP